MKDPYDYTDDNGTRYYSWGTVKGTIDAQKRVQIHVNAQVLTIDRLDDLNNLHVLAEIMCIEHDHHYDNDGG